MRAAIYVRISLDKTGTEAGVERQEQECRAMCASLGYEVGEVYRDNDLSATSGVTRPAFESLLKAKPEVVVCWHTDRFVRRSKDLQRVIDLELTVHSVRAGLLDLSTPTGRMTARIVTSVAEYEGEQKGDRQRSSHRQRAAQGRHFWGTAPFGYTVTGEAIPGEREAVLRAYQDVLRGVALTSLAKRFNHEQLLTRKGKLWSPATMRAFLLSPRNAAIATYHGEEVGEATWDALVPVETYRAVVAVLTDPQRVRVASWSKPGRKPTTLLGSIARCSKCDATMRVWRRPNEPDAYVCRRGCCTAPVDYLDSVVLRQLLATLGDDVVQAYWLADAGTFDRGALNGKAAVLSARLSETAALFAAGVITGGQLTTITGDLKPQLEAIEAELANHREPHRAAQLLRDPELMWERMLDMELSEQRELVEEVFEVVLVRPRGQKGVRFGDKGAMPFGHEHWEAVVRGTRKAPQTVMA